MSQAMIGAKTVEASPPTSVIVVSGFVRSAPYQRVMTAKAGG